MELYFLRHAIAEDKRPGGKDAERALTPEGIQKMKAAVKGMKKLKISFDRVLSSPLTRAVQTAEIVAKGLDHKDKIQIVPFLEPGGDYRDFLGILKECEGDASLLFVGHQPDLSWFIARLLSGDTRVSIHLKKGALCRVQTSELGAGLLAELEWLMTQEQLANLA
jgi:phosphohistidine phosphatase